MISVKLPHAQPGPPLLEWTGPTSGSQNMEANPILYFVATPGVYTVIVRRQMSLSWEICGNGRDGFGGGIDVDGGDGGGCGEVRTSVVTLTPGQTYTLVLQGRNVGANSYLALGGTIYVAASGANSSNAPNPSNVGTLNFPGSRGGQGGGFVTVAPDGETGSWAGGYAPGGGGGGGCGGGASLGAGGSGGGNPGSGSPPQDPGHGPPGAGGPGGNGVGWRGFGIGFGGGGGASANNNPLSGGPTPGRDGAPAGAVVSFVGFA